MNLDVPPIQVKFDLIGSRAGVASCWQIPKGTRYNLIDLWDRNWCYFKPYIALNEWYLKEYPVDMVLQTVPHEVAHIVADLHFKVHCKHSWRWRYIMWDIFGKAPIRTHKFGPSITSKKVRYYELYCPTCSFRHYFSQYSLNKIERECGLANAACHNCRKKIGNAPLIPIDNGF